MSNNFKNDRQVKNTCLNLYDIHTYNSKISSADCFFSTDVFQYSSSSGSSDSSSGKS